MVKPKTPKKDKAKKEKAPKPKAPVFAIPKEKLDVALPEGFDWTKYKALKKKDFQADHLYFTHRALDLMHRAEEFDAKAEEARTLGSGKDRNKAKRLQKMQTKMEELRKELEEQGIDVDELLKED